MKIQKWVDFGQEIEIEIGTDDVRGALADAFSRVVDPQFEDVVPEREIRAMLNTVASFFKALTDDQIEASLSESAREIAHKFFVEQATRFAVKAEGR